VIIIIIITVLILMLMMVHRLFASSRWQARVSLSFILKTNFEFSPMDTKGPKNTRENYILNECLLIVYGVL